MRRTVRLVMSVAVVAALATGCKKPPQGAISDAEKALLAAEARKDCANDKYLAAQKLLEEAKQLVEEKEYDAAERKAVAAQKMAEQARQEADANWEECNKRKEIIAEAKKPVEGDPDPVDVGPATLTTIFFAYDSAELSPAQRQQLEQNALWMRQNPEDIVVLEGHTDERGSVEYNLALGERRADAVKRYLETLGVSSDRLRTVSYGELRPAVQGHDESAWRYNRRAEFQVSK